MEGQSRRKAFVEEIRKAKKAHLKWVSYAYGLIEGLPLESNQVPVFETDCEFGRWYYGHGQVLDRLEEFRNLEAPHRDLHHQYMKIFKTLFQEEDKGFWGRLFGKSADDDDLKKEKARRYFAELQQLSTLLRNGLDRLENSLLDMTDEEFDRKFI